MKTHLLPFALSAALLSPDQANGKPEDVGSFLDNTGESILSIPSFDLVDDSKSRFREIMQQECVKESRRRVTPSGFYYYPSVGFQFNVMTQKLQLCNGGMPERLGVSDMEILECGSVNSSDAYVCTLVNKYGNNALCVIANPSLEVSMQVGNCRESFPENN